MQSVLSQCVIYFYNYSYVSFYFFFFNDTSTTEIYTLSLHDALPISTYVRRPATFNIHYGRVHADRKEHNAFLIPFHFKRVVLDRKSTRLNSSHVAISYAVFCLKKKKRKH